MGDHTTLTTFASAVVFGVLLVQLAHKINLSAIVVLLLGGVILGPSGIGLVLPGELGHNALKTIVALAIGLILFEGGLTLHIQDYGKISREIRGLLTRGVVVTWLGTATCLRLVYPDFSWQFCLLSASLVIVTGPTVIGPLLKKIHAKKGLSNILHWEGILIDPIGVFIALLCYEWIISGGEHAILYFVKRCVVGISLGVVVGFMASYIIKKSWTIQESLNGFVLAIAVAVFALSENLAHESGLLSVIVTGFMLGYLDPDRMEQVKAYKAQLIEILIGLLFILLAANLDIQSFSNYGIGLVVVVLCIMFIIRPLNVFTSTFGSRLSFSDKAFLCWIAPRGIVAASMASLFALSLKESVYPPEQAQFLETFTYSVIIGTVLFQGLTAKWVGNSLGVLTPKPSGWLVIGAHKLGRKIAAFLQSMGLSVIVVDTNIQMVRMAREEGLTAIYGNALTMHSEDYPELYQVGHILAITSNESLNALICQHWTQELSDIQIYFCSYTDEREYKRSFVVGKPVWGKLPMRRLLGTEEDECLEIETVQGTIDEIDDADKVMMAFTGGQAYPFLPPEKRDRKDREPMQYTVLRYTHTVLSEEIHMKENWVSFIEEGDLSKILHEMLEHVAVDFKDIPRESLEKYFLEQKEHNFLFGYNIALFHTYVEDLTESVVSIARLKNSIYMANQRVYLVFLVLSPSRKPQKHLSTLAELSRFLLKASNRKDLRRVENQEELLRIFF